MRSFPRSLWDLKALRGMKQDSTIDEIIDKTQITHHYHAKACSSAYFDPTGTRLATTSYDDLIRSRSEPAVFEDRTKGRRTDALRFRQSGMSTRGISCPRHAC